VATSVSTSTAAHTEAVIALAHGEPPDLDMRRPYPKRSPDEHPRRLRGAATDP
jgi:hypothetical protein